MRIAHQRRLLRLGICIQPGQRRAQRRQRQQHLHRRAQTAPL
jgi:hypothetical protein